MIRTSLTFFVIFAMASAANGQAVQSYTGGTQFSSFNSDGDTVGWFFSTSNPISVTSLGFWDAGQDGLADSHQVGIWETSTQTLVASTTVQAGTASVLTGEWRYESITPVALTPGTEYVIGAYYNPNPPGPVDNYIATVSSVTMVSGITHLGSAVDNLPAPGPNPFVMPVTRGAVNGRFGPNFLFVPEPTGLIFVALGILGILARRR